MMKNAPTKEIGIANTGIKVVRQFRKNKKIISTTSIKASTMVLFTSLIEFRIKIVLSKAIPASTSAGKSFSRSSITAYARSTISI